MLLQTSDDFVRAVRKSGLLSDDQLDDFLRRPGLPWQPLDLAKAMIADDLITGFQAEQLLQGKSRGFDLGRYRILRRLGGGSTGTVFLCEHMVMHHRVAIKVLSQNWMDSEPTALARFRREARAASALQHPNIVRTLDLDEDEGRHYLVMEYVEGAALDVLLKHKKQLPVRETVGYIVQALQGLQHIHECGMIHRDLKPGNLLLDPSGVVKILDLGLARFTDNRAEALTVQGSLIMGTIDFMSPEQGSGTGKIDIRSDIYSLGATLYMLLCGQSPVSEGTIASKILSLQFHPPKPIRSLRPEVDQKLDGILGRMMSKNPALRYQSPQEAAIALNDWIKTAATPTYETAPTSRDVPHRMLPVAMQPQSMIDTVPARQNPVPHAEIYTGEAIQKQGASGWKSMLLVVVLALVGAGIWLATK